MISHLLYIFFWKVVKMDKRRNPSPKRTIFKFGDCSMVIKCYDTLTTKMLVEIR